MLIYFHNNAAASLNENGIVVLDTNVLLNVYRYSPEFPEFALNCIKAVKDYIYLPATVELEYNKYHIGCFKDMEKRIVKAGTETANLIKNANKYSFKE